MDENTFKKLSYLLLTLILSASGYDIVKRENPELVAKVAIIGEKVDKMEEKLDFFIDSHNEKYGRLTTH